MKKYFAVIAVLIFAVSLNAQKVITPSNDLNNKFESGELDAKEYFDISYNGEEFLIMPVIPEGWTWFMVKDLPVDGKLLSFVFKDGRIFTSDNIRTNHRRIKYQEDITDKVEIDAELYALFSDKGKEKQAAFFIYTNKKLTTELIISPEIWDQNKSIPIEVVPGELKYVVMQKLPEESNPFFFPEKNAKRDTIEMNKDWSFSKGNDQSNWEEISIPHCWNATDVFDTRNINDGYYVNERYYRGPAWYKKHFTIEESEKEKVYLEFEAAFQKAEVWLNEQYLGKHLGGYTAFKFDITDIVKFSKDNMLTVKVDNSYDYNLPPHSADYYMYGGIYRDVRLILTDETHFSAEPKVTAPNVSYTNAELRVEVEIKSEDENIGQVLVVSNLINKWGEIVSTVTQNVEVNPNQKKVELDHYDIKNPYLWSPQNPYLYNVINTIYHKNKPLDEVVTPVGFRWYSFDADSGFTLNGERLFLKGINKHQDYFKLGIAVPDSIQVHDIKLLKELGANFIRLAHYPQDSAVLEACDELGMIVWQEIPLVNSAAVTEEFLSNSRNMLKEMILRDYNHPSVVMWGISNESVMGFASKEAFDNAFEIMENLNAYAKELDPNRYTVQAHNDMKDESIAYVTDLLGRNRYFGWYEMPITKFEEELKRERKEHPTWIPIISEYGVGSKLGYHVENPERYDFSEDYQLLFHEYYWKTINETPWVAGSLVWASIDFGSFTKYGNVPGVNQKGLFDFQRRKKDVYYFYKSQWTEDLMAYIVSHTQRFRHGGINEQKEVKVYCNGSEVELFLNNVSQGVKKVQYVNKWNVLFKEGQNELRVVSKKGNEIVEDEISIRYIIE
jgi:beta-galactosidase